MYQLETCFIMQLNFLIYIFKKTIEQDFKVILNIWKLQLNVHDLGFEI